MADWGFLTNHARVLLCIAADPSMRLRDIAATINVTERTVFGAVTDLAEAGYIVKERDGRRNHYEIQHDLPLAEPTPRERTVGDLLELLAGPDPVHHDPSRAPRRKQRSAATRGSAGGPR